ncbi:hypothetical protein PR202_gb09685 [Eleusine coracana subsp. coracana]|uniref:CDT1 Geminin-binding domain-containing protein n=1 Tax=Eleusine coracana subsp. coracana TaxID=191504 RepID=A0AAV5EI04_ELECO|nr:hypothetical protein PR202_gb09685 [Eleusine coracana subsp. coracana]
MDAATPSKRAKTSAFAAGTPEKSRKAGLVDQVMTPEKPAQNLAPAPSATEQIWTPEKPEQRPTARGRNVAFSVKGVRRAALGLRRPEKGPAEAPAKEDELESLEKELGVGSGSGRSPVKRKAEVKLPESYEMLSEFFNCLESSTRLLRLKGSKASFPNICASIQHLSERRFTYSHLAQLKYIMPESIVINKILVRDETTCCMKPDLQVNLLVDAVESAAKQKGETAYSVLRRIFRQRLIDFFRDHPESFKRRFSRGSPVSSATANTTSAVVKIESIVPSPLSTNSLSSSDASGSLCVDATSNAKKDQVPGEDEKDVVSCSAVTEGTPAKFLSTPMRLMASTPALKTPKRPISATGDDTLPLKIVKRSARAKLSLLQQRMPVVKAKEQRALEGKETGFADQELIHKIIASSPKIIDRSEVEEQLALLEEFVPDWISEKTGRSGDILCCVDVTLSQADIRQRLYVAK